MDDQDFLIVGPVEDRTTLNTQMLTQGPVGAQRMGDLAGSRDSRTPGAYAMNVDLAAVKAAATPDLVKMRRRGGS
jgi:hypothetical protein